MAQEMLESLMAQFAATSAPPVAVMPGPAITSAPTAASHNGISYLQDYNKVKNKLFPCPNNHAKSTRKGYNHTGLLQELPDDKKIYWLSTNYKEQNRDPAVYREVKELV